MVDPAGQFAGDRQVGPFRPDTLADFEEVTVVRRGLAGSGERRFEQSYNRMLWMSGEKRAAYPST